MNPVAGDVLDAAHATAATWLRDNAADVSGLSDAIWRYAEPGMREERSAAALCRFLREAEFSVEEPIANSSVFVFPITGSPAARQRAATVASKTGT